MELTAITDNNTEGDADNYGKKITSEFHSLASRFLSYGLETSTKTV
jgi:hypothetical protein